MNHALALNFALDGLAPAWVQLLPAGPDVRGADGRAWTLDDPAALIAAFQRRATPLVIDWEHASEHRAPHGLDAPAAGWIDALEARADGLWGHVEWTERAAQQIQTREYRFLSPVFQYEKASGRIVQLTSAGLTNQPNLPLVALNREEPPMTFPTAVCSALGLPAAADESAVLTALNTLKTALDTATQRAEAPPLEKFVPRADYDAALAHAANAETRIREMDAARIATQIEVLLDRGLAAGQIVPATVDYYRAMCQTAHGLEAFETFLAKAPAVIGAPTDLDDRAPPPGKALNRAQFDALSPSARREHLARGGVVTD